MQKGRVRYLYGLDWNSSRDAKVGQQAAYGKHIRMIDLQSCNGSSPTGRFSLNVIRPGFGPAKMIRPGLRTRIEMSRGSSCHRTGHFYESPFARVAMRARKRQVLQFSLAASTPRPNVINGE